MAPTEKIKGHRILRLFEELRQNSTLLRIHLPHTDYSQATCVLDLRQRNKNTFFRIDYPAGFREAIADADGRSLDFEFIGKDNVKYYFSTRSEDIFDEITWLKLPRIVEREQRRKLYRLAAPSGTTLYIYFASKRYELKVIDISLGGSLGVLAGIPRTTQQDPILAHTGILENIEVIFPPKEENLQVSIKRSKVKRLGENPLTKQHEYALEFLEMDQTQMKILTDLIYRFQRRFLRNRLRINA